MTMLSALFPGLRDGRWLTRQRLRVVPIMLLVGGGAALIGLVATSDGVLDRNGRPLGTDFANVYAAGRMALEGQAAQAWNWAAHHLAQQAVAGRPDVPFYGWHYPPMFLLLAAALASLPYLPALLVWQATSLVGFLAVVRAILRPVVPQSDERIVLLVAVGFPAVLVNLLHGQNGFFTAALLGGALLTLDRRPLLAGALIGLLAYKPQFGLLIPLALIASGRHLAIASASFVTILVAAAATLTFGPGIWPAFVESLDLTRRVVLEAGDTGFHKLQTLFAALRLWGASITVSHGAQAALMLVLAALIVRLWRSPAPFTLKAAGLVTASLLATPYTLDYDLVVSGLAIAFLVRDGFERGFSPFEASFLALAWAAPLLTRTVQQTAHLPLGFLVLLGLFVLTLHRAGVLAPSRQERVTRAEG
jgi:alpha-1,2-mannosyltransferase